MSLLDFNAQLIPLNVNDKRPREKYVGKKFDTKELIDGAKLGRNNVGLLTQPNFIFIDIDVSHGCDGLKNFVSWCVENYIVPDELFENTLVQTTPTNGVHLIFLRPENFNFKQNISFLDGVDIKASDNNYIVIAPSEINGKPYKFENPKVDPIVLPKKLAHAMEAHAKKTEAKKKRQIKAGKVTSEGLLYQNEYTQFPRLDVFYTIEHGFGQIGCRNDNVFKWTQEMRKITDKETCLKYAKKANNNSSDPIPEIELENTIKSAYEYSIQRKTIKESGETWVLLGNKGIDRYAVLEEVFNKNGSVWDDEYDKEDLYLSDEKYKNALNYIPCQTIYNYKK